jgi:hypothetical protein
MARFLPVETGCGTRGSLPGERLIDEAYPGTVASESGIAGDVNLLTRRRPRVPEIWYLVADVGAEQERRQLPPGAVPGTRLIVGRGDTSGSGTLFVTAAPGDVFFGGGAGTECLVLMLPMTRCEFEYGTVRPADGTTADGWHRLAD